MEKPHTGNIIFESQTADEQVLFLLRAHFITNLPWILTATVLAFVPPLFLISNFFAGFEAGFRIPESSIEGFILIWYLVVFAYVFQHFLHWYFNIYVLTDRRIVDIDFFQLLYKRVSTTSLDNIEDVTASMGGVAQTIFHYGDVHIQTAGTNVNFDFLKVPDPGKVKHLIDEQIHKRKQNQ